ncbi:amino acid permease/ SLC12A domain-containing protein [Mrakia frigida]|uniref:amino acid permease/ SLC12A domain-containing protein n=1 Tax=Mrakia frigida TaxID=29902 RepID=UPI003FCBFAF4
MSQTLDAQGQFSSPEEDVEKKGLDREDFEVDPVALEVGGEGGVKRNLKERHLAMIALGGTIGTGLFVGSGSALANGGPVGALLGYLVMGLAVYSMMIALGEMGTLFPDSGNFTHFATRFLDPSMGFAVGLNFAYCYSISLPVELVASALVIEYWNATISQAAWIAPLFFLILVVNLLPIYVYGELEFWFSAMKITAIVGLIILGIVLNCGGGPAGDYIGFRYWKDPGPFAQLEADDGTIVAGSWGRFLAFWSVMVQAAFSFIGVEVVSITVGEAQNPRVAFPKAIRRTFWRIIIFYVLGILVIGLLVPYNSERLLNSNGNDASASPFVIAIENAGIKALPSIINAVILIAAWSAGNSYLYAASRTLYSLAIEGKLPRIFRYCTSSGLPLYCIAVSGSFGFLAFLSLGNAGANSVFNWLYIISSITGIITWQVILASHLRFYYGMKRQNLSRDNLPWKAPFQPYSSWFGFIFFGLVILMNGFTIFIGDSFTFTGLATAYICLPIFGAFCLLYKLFGGAGERSGPRKIFRLTKWVSLEDMDFTTGLRELDEMDAREQLKKEKPKSWAARVWSALF